MADDVFCFVPLHWVGVAIVPIIMCGVDDAVYIGIIVVLWAALIVFACRRQRPIQINVPEFRMRDMPSVINSNASSPLSATHTFARTIVTPQSDDEHYSQSRPSTEDL